MLITEKDLNLDLRCLDISHIENNQDNILFIIPKLTNSDLKYFLMPNKTDYISKEINKDLKDYFSEFIAPNYIDFIRVKENKDTPVYSERFNVIFDIDEDIIFYYKLKFN